MNSRWVVVCGVAIVVAVAAWLLVGSNEPDNRGRPGGDRTAHVNVIEPERRTVQDRVEAVGSTQARDNVEVTSEVDARIEQLHFAPGEPVKEGELLVTLDDRRARAELERASARLEDAEARNRRAQRLHADGNISAAEADERKADLRVARAEQSRAELELAHHRIYAPFDGLVGLRELSRGAWLRAGERVTTLDSIDPMELHFAIPERYMAAVNRGDMIRARSKAWPEHVFEGEVNEISSRVDPLSRNLRMKASLDNSDRRLRPGQFMILSLSLGERDSLIIPEEALLTEGREQYVFVIREGKAEHRTVETGPRNRGEVEIREGLDDNERVVVNGQDRLEDGQAVEIEQDPEALVPRDREGA